MTPIGNSRFQQIGTFDVELRYPVGARSVVIDRDASNSWGRKYFLTYEAAARWAKWAHAFKTGRTVRRARGQTVISARKILLGKERGAHDELL